MSSLLADYPVITEIPVAWGEMDAFSHVNNVVYFRYFETARIDYFTKIALLEDMYKTGIGPILGETQARYRLPVTFPDTLLVGSRIADLERDRFIMEYAIVSQRQQAITTMGTAKVVMFDFNNNKKSTVSPQLREAILALEEQKR